VTALLVQTFLC